MHSIKNLASLSIYRGQSDTGIGEGPGGAVPRGEQYLQADEPIASNSALLRQLRPWLTLDADPADTRRLGGDLESWSSFCTEGHQFVVRLVSAGRYDRRDAYFAHARGFPSPGRELDPGLLLGRASAFDTPWRDLKPGSHIPGLVPADAFRIEVPDNLERVRSYLQYLLQAKVERRPLVIAAPLAEFGTAGSLARAIALARAALPPQIAQACRLRVYTSRPDRFLRHYKADLIAIPDALASDVVRTHTDIILLDHTGRCRSRLAVDPRAASYAEGVTKALGRLPAGLVPFTERYGTLHRSEAGGWPVPSDKVTLQVLYNLAFGLAGSTERRDAMLREYLMGRELRPSLPWQRLLSFEDWKRFSDGPVVDLLCEASDPSSPRRGLQVSAEDAVTRFSESRRSGIGRCVEERFSDPADLDSTRRRRLLELFGKGLLSYQAVRAQLGKIPLSEIRDHKLVLSTLTAEAEAGSLHHRSADPGLVAWARQDPQILEILTRATSRGELSRDWAEEMLADLATNRDTLTRWACLLLTAAMPLEPWGDVLDRCLDHWIGKGLEPARRQDLLEAARIAPARLEQAPLTLARLVELQDVSGTEGLLSDVLRERRDRAFHHLSAETREEVLSWVEDDRWRSLGREDLFGGRNELTWPWLRDHLLRLLAYPEASRLSTAWLLEQSDSVPPRELFALLDRRMREDLEATTTVLVAEGWWPIWRRRQASHVHPRPAALAWLGCSWWRDPRHSSRRDIAPSFETWKQVIEDLEGRLDSDEARNLVPGERAAWPIIPPFELDQLEDLGKIASDLDALVFLAGGIRGTLSPEHRPILFENLLKSSDFDPFLSSETLAGLLGSEGEISQRTEELPLAASLELFRRSSAFRAPILEGRVRAILKLLDRDPVRALEAASVEEANLWQQRNETFLRGLAAWLCRASRTAPFDPTALDPAGQIVEMIERRLPEGFQLGVSDADKKFLCDLEASGRRKLVAFLGIPVPGQIPRAASSREGALAEKVLRAFVNQDEQASCWYDIRRVLRQRKSRHPSEEHLFFEFADLFRKWNLDRHRLQATAWSTFSKAASHCGASEFFAEAVRTRPLPALDLLAALTRQGDLGSLALGIMFAADEEKHLTRSEWWMTLLRGLVDCPRHGGLSTVEDRPDVALALIRSRVVALPEPAQDSLITAIGELRRFGKKYAILNIQLGELAR